MKDVNEFLASIELNPRMGEVRATVTYQDSCHLAHGQKIRSAPRQLLARVPGLTVKEMRLSDLCCGSAGIYNVLHTDMSMQLLEKKMETVNATGAERIATANPGCMLATPRRRREARPRPARLARDRDSRRSLPGLPLIQTRSTKTRDSTLNTLFSVPYNEKCLMRLALMTILCAASSLAADLELRYGALERLVA